jgi:hypothetical protein
MTFRMRSGATVPRARCCCRLRPQINQRACLPPMFPPTSLAAGVPAAHRQTARLNGLTWPGEVRRGRP